MMKGRVGILAVTYAVLLLMIIGVLFCCGFAVTLVRKSIL